MASNGVFSCMLAINLGLISFYFLCWTKSSFFALFIQLPIKQKNKLELIKTIENWQKDQIKELYESCMNGTHQLTMKEVYTIISKNYRFSLKVWRYAQLAYICTRIEVNDYYHVLLQIIFWWTIKSLSKLYICKKCF